MLDWIAAIFEISGLWIIGNKKKFGFVLLILCSSSWIVLGICNQLYGLSLAALVCFIIHIRNYLKWTKNEKKEKAKN